MSKETKPVVIKPIYSINIDHVENGYVIGYLQDNKAKRRVFYTWDELVDWLHSQNDPVKEIPRPGMTSVSSSTFVEEGPLLKDE